MGSGGGGGGLLIIGGGVVSGGFSGSTCGVFVPLGLLFVVVFGGLVIGVTVGVSGLSSLVMGPAPHVQQKSKEINERGDERCGTPVFVADFGPVGVVGPAFERVADVDVFVLLVEIEIFFEGADDWVAGSSDFGPTEYLASPCIMVCGPSGPT